MIALTEKEEEKKALHINSIVVTALNSQYVTWKRNWDHVYRWFARSRSACLYFSLFFCLFFSSFSGVQSGHVRTSILFDSSVTL